MLPGVTLIPTKPVKVESVPILSFYFLARPIRRGVGRTLRRCKKRDSRFSCVFALLRNVAEGGFKFRVGTEVIGELSVLFVELEH